MRCRARLEEELAQLIMKDEIQVKAAPLLHDADGPKPKPKPHCALLSGASGAVLTAGVTAVLVGASLHTLCRVLHGALLQ